MDEVLVHQIAAHKSWLGYTPSSEAARLGGCDNSLRRLQSQCQFYRRWAACYRDRTNSRINLVCLPNVTFNECMSKSIVLSPRRAQVHHLATQQDNRLTQQINDYTSQVALQTQRDGASMFTIAVVTAIFLPGTFVSVSPVIREYVPRDELTPAKSLSSAPSSSTMTATASPSRPGGGSSPSRPCP